MKNNLNVLLFVFGLMFLSIISTNVSAFNMDISYSRTTISNEGCGATAPVGISVTNKGTSYGILCWYSVDKSNWIKGTSACIVPDGGSATFNANVNMPSSGTSSPTLYIACRNYGHWGLFSGYVNDCQDSNIWSTDYAEGYTKTTNCLVNGLTDADCVYQQALSLSCTPLNFVVTSIPSSLQLLCGESKSFTVTVQNSDTRSLSCTYSATGGSLSSSGNTGSITAGSSKDVQLTVIAPSSCTKTQFTYTTGVSCSDSVSGLSGSKSTSVLVSFDADPCIAAINDAKNSISDAQTAITNAQAKIQEATNLGADITSSQASLNQANSKLTSSQTQLSTAQTTCNSGDTTNGVSQANTAKNYAVDAKTYATNALNSAQESITTFTKLKTDASNKISSAGSAIDTSKKAIKEAESLISNATILGGMDTPSAKADVTTARSKSKSADDYYKEASSAFDSNNYELTKTKATSAESYAKEAENLATSAYNTLWTVYDKKRVGAEAILAANTQVSKMNEIMTKMDYVLRKVRDYNVDLAATQSTVDDSKTNVDSAEDLLSQAKNRLESSYSDQAVELAVQAKTQADSASNRLDTIVTKLKFSISDALKLALKDKQKQVLNANSEVKSAETTYGADSEKVIEAQRAVSDAETKLKEAESTASQVETAESLSTLMQNAEAAFVSLDEVEQKVQIATSKANEAKIGLYTTVATAGVAVASVGGGFLYWRRRKNKGPINSHKNEKQKHENITKESKHEEDKKHEISEKNKMKENTKKSEDEKQKGKFCHKCGTTLEKYHKFCPKCGAKTK